MGIDYDGGMIIGNYFEEISIPEEWYEEQSNDYETEWIEENDLSRMCPWPDAHLDACIVGFEIPDVKVKDMDEAWMDMIKEKAKKFEELTGAEAILIGAQDVW